MLDQILSWLVLVVPVALGLVLILVPEKHEDEKRNKRWRLILGVCLILYGGLSWLQQSRALRASAKDRETAIQEASQKVAATTSASVTRTVTDLYSNMISEQKNQIAQLQNQLAVQGKDVSVIKSSNIVTGKSPIKVEIAGAREIRHQVANIVMSSSSVQSIHPDATYCRKLIFTSEFSTNPVGLTEYFPSPVKYVDSMVTFVYKGFVRVSKDNPKQAEIAMIGFNEDVLKPERPIVVNVCAESVFEPVKLERRNVVEN